MSQFVNQRDECEAKQRGRIATRKQTRFAEFSKLGSPSKEAEFDRSLFLSKHFLDDNGAPDRSKTRQPLSLPGLDNIVSLSRAASKIPGLHTRIGETDDTSRVLVIGWDEGSVWEEADRISSQNAVERKKKQREKKMQEHRDYVARRKHLRAKKTFDAKYAVGSYIVECKSISEQWPDMDDLTMNITQAKGLGELVADFDFGVLDGIMRLGSDAELLSTPPEYDEDETAFPGSKRKWPAQRSGSQSSKKSRKSTSSGQPRRLYLRWRGRETGEGELEMDDDDSNTGYLDFVDNSCTAFNGVADLTFVGPKVTLCGYKISSDGGEMIKSWDAYTEENYLYTRIARWE
jgi:hypothetical protein